MKQFVKDIQALLSPSEIQRLQSIDESEITNQAFSEMDRDGDGKVTEEEFVRATLNHEKVATLLTMKIVNVLQP